MKTSLIIIFFAPLIWAGWRSSVMDNRECKPESPASLTVSGLLPQDKKDFNRLKALVGTWVRQTASGPGYEEWVIGNDDNLRGREYRVVGSDTVVRERVNLARKQQQVVYAVTGSDPKEPLPVAFFLVEAGRKRFVFANPTHDFPKRIVYEFRGTDSLHAWIDGGEKDAEARVDYYYRRMK